MVFGGISKRERDRLAAHTKCKMVSGSLGLRRWLSGLLLRLKHKQISKSIIAKGIREQQAAGTSYQNFQDAWLTSQRMMTQANINVTSTNQHTSINKHQSNHIKASSHNTRNSSIQGPLLVLDGAQKRHERTTRKG
jgi:hypothetical protein